MEKRDCEICEFDHADNGIMIMFFVCDNCRRGKKDEELFMETLEGWKRGNKILFLEYRKPEE